MMRDEPVRRLPMALSALVALALAVMPLPAPVDAFRPDFLVLVVFYWSIESPRAGGLALAFVSGLALDVIRGVVLGQHALALTLMAAWATHLRLRLRLQQQYQYAMLSAREAQKWSAAPLKPLCRQTRETVPEHTLSAALQCTAPMPTPRAESTSLRTPRPDEGDTAAKTCPAFLHIRARACSQGVRVFRSF